MLTIEVDENRCEKLVIDDPSRYREAASKFIKDLSTNVVTKIWGRICSTS